MVKTKSVRDVYTINGEFAGPPIEVHRGDVLHVTLVNEVPVEYPQASRSFLWRRKREREWQEQERGKNEQNLTKIFPFLSKTLRSTSAPPCTGTASQ